MLCLSIRDSIEPLEPHGRGDFSNTTIGCVCQVGGTCADSTYEPHRDRWLRDGARPEGQASTDLFIRHSFESDIQRRGGEQVSVVTIWLNGDLCEARAADSSTRFLQKTLRRTSITFLSRTMTGSKPTALAGDPSRNGSASKTWWMPCWRARIGLLCAGILARAVEMNGWYSPCYEA